MTYKGGKLSKRGIEWRKAIKVVACLIVLVVGVFARSIQPANSANSYISDIKFYTDDDGYLRIHFAVDQTFTHYYIRIATHYCGGYDVQYNDITSTQSGTIWGGIMPSQWVDLVQNTISCPHNTTITYTQGQEYDEYYMPYWQSCNVGTGGLTCLLTAEPNNTWTALKIGQQFSDTEVYEMEEEVSDPEIVINSPTENSEWEIPLEVDIDYSNATGYDFLRVYIVGSDENDIEIISKSGLVDIDGVPADNIYLGFSGLPVGRYFLSAQFLNSDTGGSFYAVDTVEFDVTEYIPSFFGTDLEPDDWSQPEYFSNITYYSEMSSYATPTAFYTALTDPFDPIANWVAEKTHALNLQFDQAIAKTQGAKMAEGITVARYHINQFNDLFGGFPFGDTLVMLLFVTIAVAIIRMILSIRRMF